MTLTKDTEWVTYPSKTHRMCSIASGQNKFLSPLYFRDHNPVQKSYSCDNRNRDLWAWKVIWPKYRWWWRFDEQSSFLSNSGNKIFCFQFMRLDIEIKYLMGIFCIYKYSEMLIDFKHTAVWSVKEP